MANLFLLSAACEKLRALGLLELWEMSSAILLDAVSLSLEILAGNASSAHSKALHLPTRHSLVPSQWSAGWCGAEHAAMAPLCIPGFVQLQMGKKSSRVCEGEIIPSSSTSGMRDLAPLVALCLGLFTAATWGRRLCMVMAVVLKP